MKIIILLTCSSPLAMWASTFAQAVPTDVSAVSWLQGASSLGFAGLVWFLLAVRDPKRDTEVRSEREQLMSGFKDLMSEHREEREKWRVSMDNQNERSREAAASGHKVASELTQQLQRLADAQA